MDYGLLAGLGEGLQKGVAAYMEGRKQKKAEDLDAEKLALLRREEKLKNLETGAKLAESGVLTPDLATELGMPQDGGLLGIKTKKQKEAEKQLPQLQLSAMDKGLEPFITETGEIQFRPLSAKTPGMLRKEKKEGYELSESEYKSKYAPVDALRKEWSDHPTTKETGIKNLAYKKILSSQKAGGTAASDMSLIFGFMKLQDPGSTVREGEYATAENARGIPETIRNSYNKIVDGQKLTPGQRADFTNNAKQIYLSQLEAQDEVNRQYGEIAKKRGLDVGGVVVPTYTPKEQAEFKEKKPPASSGLLPKAQAEQPSQTTGKILVSNGRDNFWIDPKDVDDAKREGFRPMSGGQ